MSNKGKSMECIQYQQTLHRNLVFLAGLADPNLNIQALIPSPGTNPPSQHSTTQLPPSSGSPQPSFPTSAGSSPGSTPVGAVSSGASQQVMRQPQATMNPASTTTDSKWSANSQAARATPPSSMSSGQYPPGGSMRNFEGAGWNNHGQQQGLYGMQQGGGFGSMMPSDERQRQQMLRMRQEQLIQAQQMRRMQMQQSGGPGSAPGGGGMFPGMGPSSGMIPPGGMPPGYPQTSMMQMPMPHGSMNMH